MNWRHKLSLSFLPLFAILYFVMKERPNEVVKTPAPIRRIASFPQKQAARKIISPRTIAALKGKAVAHSILRNRIPQSVEATFEKDTSVKVTRGYDLLKDVAAIAKDEFKPSMGEVIQENEHFVFFRAGENHQHVPAAISKSTNLLYPLSSVVHVRDVSPETRRALLNAGYKQYYYHAPLKLLSLQGGTGKTLALYQDLLKKGFKAELEVLKPPHQAN